MGDKKWHLPDISQTEEERKKEIEMLKLRKKQQEEEDARMLQEQQDRRLANRRGTEKFELGGPEANRDDSENSDAPFLLLKNESENLKNKNNDNKNMMEKQNKKGSSCPCCIVQ